LAFRDQPVTVTWINDIRDFSTGLLRTEHYLPVDTCPHGADDQAVRAVVHLHGGHVPPEADGYPEATFLPGSQDVYQYPNGQLASTLWYHDHALGITRLNVYMGLAGFYLLGDPVEQALNLPAGEFEIGLAIQDRSFHPDGSLKYPEVWQDNFLGDTLLVNGKVWPYLNVKQGKYRFRILSGSNTRTYTIALSNAATFQQIGAEGGLLSAPVTQSEVTLGPGERADVIMDFEPYPAGTEIILTNSAPAPFPGSPGVGVIPNVMKFIVQDAAGDTDPVPSTLQTLEILDENDAVEFRTFELKKAAGDPCAPLIWGVVSTGTLNGTPTGSRWDDIIEYPELDTTEVWSFVNRSGITHPMHMHLVMFQVLDRQAFEEQAGQIVPIGSPIPPPPHEAGWKDTVQVGPNEIVRVISRFEGYTGKFAYHCHILEHEDHEMMRQFQTVQCGNLVIEPGEECDDGNPSSADRCSSTCEDQDTLRLLGLAEGGSVEITVDGQLIVQPTTGGQTPAEVMAALAAAIESDPTLSALGVTALSAGDTLYTTGAISSVTITDPGLYQVALPALSRPGLAALVALLGIGAFAGLRRLRRDRIRN
jgi:spore coat protein A